MEDITDTCKTDPNPASGADCPLQACGVEAQQARQQGVAHAVQEQDRHGECEQADDDPEAQLDDGKDETTDVRAQVVAPVRTQAHEVHEAVVPRLGGNQHCTFSLVQVVEQESGAASEQQHPP